MNMIFDIVSRDIIILVAGGLSILLLILYLVTIAKLSKVNKNYKVFMNKVGNGTNLDEVLEQYMDKVTSVKNENDKIQRHCEKLDSEVAKCIQKVGIVRYSAFRDSGSDLSFALALLDDKNNGVVMNGIYSREISNIYAKPVVDGKSTYTISEEEQQAINKAVTYRE